MYSSGTQSDSKDWIQIASPMDAEDALKCVDVSFGTVQGAVAHKSHNYSDTAYVPVSNWNPLDIGTFRKIFTGKIVTLPRCGFFRVDRNLAREFPRELGTIDLQSGIGHHPDRQLLNEIVAYIDESFEAIDQTIVHGCVWVEPLLPTVTVNRQTGRRLGIHLDSWDSANYAERDISRTRISINLGPHPRSFLFVPLSLRRIADAIFGSSMGSETLGPHELLPAYFERHNMWPILRFNLQPGMGYFADTDNLLHDGSSMIAKGPTLHFTVRGRFQKLFVGSTLN